MRPRIDNSRPNELAKWIFFVASAFPIAACFAFNQFASRPGDATGNELIFAPISFVFAVVSAFLTCARWRGATAGDKFFGLLPLSFPILTGLFGNIPVFMR
jgi:hypothetical protein